MSSRRERMESRRSRRDEEEGDRSERRSLRGSDRRRSSRGSGGSRRGKKRFEYSPRTAEQLDRRANQEGGSREGFIDRNFTEYKPKDGDNCVRVLPPTWDDAEHFGLEVWVHWGAGPDGSNYICPKHTPDADGNTGDCPICDEADQAKADGDKDYADALKAKKRVLYWVVDRDDERNGPQVWACPWTMDRDLSALAIDERSREVIPLDDPEEGYDVTFKKTGKMRNTKYVGLQIARRSSDLGRDADEWLDFIMENPLNTVYKVQDFDYLEEAFQGGVNIRSRMEEDDDGEDRGERRGRSRDRERDSDRKGRGGRRGRAEADVLDEDELLELDWEQLADIVDERGLDVDPDEFEGDSRMDSFVDAIMEANEEADHDDRDRDRERFRSTSRSRRR